jgi:predicted Zn-dependent protease
MTGGAPAGVMQPPPGPPPRDTKLEALAARVQANPTDGDAVADLAVHLIRQQAFDDARPLVARAVMIDPYIPKARVGRAVLRAFDGDPNGATTELERLAARYPEAYDGLLFAGMLSLDMNDTRRALKNFDAFVATAPQGDQPPMVRMVAQQIRQELAGAPKP